MAGCAHEQCRRRVTLMDDLTRHVRHAKWIKHHQDQLDRNLFQLMSDYELCPPGAREEHKSVSTMRFTVQLAYGGKQSTTILSNLFTSTHRGLGKWFEGDEKLPASVDVLSLVYCWADATCQQTDTPTYLRR